MKQNYIIFTASIKLSAVKIANENLHGEESLDLKMNAVYEFKKSWSLSDEGLELNQLKSKHLSIVLKRFNILLLPHRCKQNYIQYWKKLSISRSILESIYKCKNEVRKNSSQTIFQK